MRSYDKSILRLLDACKRSLCGIEYKSLIFIILSDYKNELERLCKALIETANGGSFFRKDNIKERSRFKTAPRPYNILAFKTFKLCGVYKQSFYLLQSFCVWSFTVRLLCSFALPLFH